MQIIIPMSGFGERFRNAGYTVPKPLIEIEGKPIIAHVIDMFPGEANFTFICNQEHLNEPSYNMRKVLQHYCPTGKIVGIASHKLGPVFAVCQIENIIKLNEPVVVNYCDFTCYWDWLHFKQWVIDVRCMGAVPAYKGFHPHTLGTTNYAYIREQNGWMLDIQEKQPFTNDRMNEYASSGTYYFATGQVMLDAFHNMMQQNLTVKDEFYVSLAYKYLLEKQLPVAIYELQHFMQWGTPEDVAEYKRWSDIFHKLNTHNFNDKQRPQGTVIIPMAGLGHRYAQAGYTTTKPLIPVSGKPMVVQATNDLPKAICYVFVLRSDMSGFAELCQILQNTYNNVVIKTLPTVTEGQACTALIGLEALREKFNAELPTPITFGACDNGVLYDQQKLQQLFSDSTCDVIVWGVRGHPHAIRNPKMYGWIEANDNLISSVSVKEPLLSPESDPIIIGTFTFKRATDFFQCVERMIARNARVNDEFYLDTCINDAIALGLNCQLFEVDNFISWGTPNDLRTFEYWQSCFHKWNGHPYQIQNDTHVAIDQCGILEKQYKKTVPHLLKVSV